MVKLRGMKFSRQLTLKESFLFCVRRLRIGKKRSLLRDRYWVSSRDALSLQGGNEGVVGHDQTMAAKENTVSVALMQFIFVFVSFNFRQTRRFFFPLS